MRLVGIETAMQTLPRSKVVEMFISSDQLNKVDKYNKFGVVKARQAIRDEKIDTVINGKKETTNTAKAGDYIIENPNGEQYIISESKFIARYSFKRKLNELWSEYKALGSCWAYQYKGKSFQFDAPWGELMLVENGDYIAVANIKNLDDIYRIEQTVFKQTYKKA